MAYDRLADAIIKHAKLIVAAWIVILAVAAVPAISAFSNMSYDMNEMGIEESESMEGLAIIGTYFPSSDADASALPMLVIGYDDKEEHDQALQMATALQEERSEYLTYEDEEGAIHEKIASISLMMDTGLTYDPETGEEVIVPGIVLLSLSYTDWDGDVIDDTPVLREQIDAALTAYEADNSVEFTLSTYLTGNPAVSYDMEAGAMEDISHIDVFTVLMILILVGLFFRSFITSAMPPVTMGVAFAVTMGLIYGLMFVMDIFFVTEILLLVSMMGAGCDYCIFILARYREERRDGKDHHAALHSAIKWAGESITISGASVIIGFGAMSICSFSMIHTMGICLALGIVVALLAALTFIPALLEVVGDRIFWPTKMKEYHDGGKATRGWFAWCSKVGHSYFDKNSRFTLKHAKAITAVAIIVTVPAAYVALESDTSYDMTSSLMTGDSEAGMDLLGEYADQGMIYPNYVLLQFDDSVATIEQNMNADGTPILGPDGNPTYSLTWTDYWLNDQKQAMESMAAEFMTDENISEVTLPYEWSDVIEDSGQNLTSPTGEGMITMQELLAMYMSGDMSQMMAAMAYIESAVAVQEYALEAASGTERIVLEAMFPMMQAEYVANLEAQLGPMVSMLPEGMLEQIATFLMVTTGAASIDYTVNVNLGIVGGDYVATGSGSANYLKVSAATHDAAMSHRSMDSIAYMQSVVDDYTGEGSGITASWVTGTAVIMYDISEIISGEFTMIELLVIVLIIVLLFFVMRSYTIPLRSVATILMSICWTLAATHLLFGDEVTWLIPLILLVICLGLGMDYDILLTTRIKENVRFHGMSNDEAIHHAVVHSGSVITICGLIMGGAFGTLMLSSMGMLQQFGFALCFAILCDALIVRTYIVPAVMHLLGDWNWKGPRFLMSKAEKAAMDEKSE